MNIQALRHRYRSFYINVEKLIIAFIFLISAGILTAFSPHPLFASEQAPPYDNRSFWLFNPPKEWPVQVMPGIRGGAGTTKIYIDNLIPVIGTKYIIAFADMKAVIGPSGSNEQNAGIGARSLLFGEKFILGGNFFYDTRYTETKLRHHQLAFGLEGLSKWADVRTNFYFPVSGRQRIPNEETTYKFSSRSLIAMDKYEEPLRGLDYEGGVLIPYLSEYCETRFLMGGYHYFPKDDKALNGIKGRAEIRPIKGVTLNLELKHDNYKDTNFYVEGVISIPLDEMNIFKIINPFTELGKYFSYKKGTRPLRERMVDRIVRDIDVTTSPNPIIEESKARDMTYVDNSNTTGIEDGSYEHPYTKVQDGVDNATGDKWVYVRKGSGNYNEGVNLKSGITLWGSGYDGGFKGVSATGYPVIDGEENVNRPINILNANNVKVMGLDMRNCIAGVVYVEKTSDATIQNCIISGNRKMGGGIYILGSPGYTAKNINIMNNIFYDNDAASIYVGSHVNNADFDGVNVVGNTIRDNSGGAGMLFENMTSTFKNITVANNNIFNIGNVGIRFANEAVYADEAKLLDNIKILNNTLTSVYDGITCAVLYGKLDNVTISGNNISVDRRGIELVAGDPGMAGRIIDNAVVSNNTIRDGEDGLVFASYGYGSNIQAEVSRNVVTNNSRFGVLVLNEDAGSDVTVDLGGGLKGSPGYNSIYNNTHYNVISDLGIVSVPVTAKYNWWGQAPPDPNKISEGVVLYAPWLTSDPN